MRQRKGPRPFRFEAMWLDEKSCHATVENGWNNPGSSWAEPGVLGKIERCASDLREWEGTTFGNVNRELARIKAELAELERGMNGDLVERRRDLQGRLRELEEREELM